MPFDHPSDNPLLAAWDAPHGLPPFSAIRPEHFAPAFAQALARHRGEPMHHLPAPRATMAEFKQLIGWHALEQRQASLELGDSAPGR